MSEIPAGEMLAVDGAPTDKRPPLYVTLFFTFGDLRDFCTTIHDEDRISLGDGGALIPEATRRYNQLVVTGDYDREPLLLDAVGCPLDHFDLVVVANCKIISFTDHFAVDHYRFADGLDEEDHEAWVTGV